MGKRTLVSIAVTFVLTMLLGGAVHGGLLKADYEALGIMRTPESQAEHFLWMILAHVAMSVAYVLVYLRGRESRPWLGQGLRFGLLMALATCVPYSLIYFAVMPFPIGLVIKQIVFDTAGMIVVGVVIAWMNRT